MLGEERSKQEIVRFWCDGSQEDWDFAIEVWKSGKNLHNSLFFAQLALEKALKALHYSKREDHPLMTHDLVLLARKAGLELGEEKETDLKEISSFNISARYDDYKRSFRKKADKQFTDEWIGKAEKLRDDVLGLMEGQL